MYSTEKIITWSSHSYNTFLLIQPMFILVWWVLYSLPPTLNRSFQLNYDLYHCSNFFWKSFFPFLEISFYLVFAIFFVTPFPYCTPHILRLLIVPLSFSLPWVRHCNKTLISTFLQQMISVKLFSFIPSTLKAICTRIYTRWWIRFWIHMAFCFILMKRPAVW